MGGQGTSDAAEVRVAGWFVAQFDAGGSRREAAILALRDEALQASAAVVRSVARQHGRRDADAEDLADEVMLAGIEERAEAIRRCNPDVPLGAWCRGTARNIEAARWESVRRERRLGDEFDVESGASSSPGESEGADAQSELPQGLRSEDVAGLPEPLAQAALACGGCRTLREASRRAGLNWSTFLRRFHEAMRRLALPPGQRGEPDATWALIWARRVARDGDTVNATILRLWFAGVTAKRIGEALSSPLSKEAVHSRVQRLRAAARKAGVVR